MLQARAEDGDAAKERAGTWTKYWHRSFSLTGGTLEICRRARKAGINQAEREILVAIILCQLGLTDACLRPTCMDVVAMLGMPPRRRLGALRRFSQDARLIRSGLLTFQDDDLLPERLVSANEELLDSILADSYRQKRPEKKSDSMSREPRLGLESLVLSAEVQKALDMVVAQVRHAEVMLRSWGLAEKIPYGRAVTLLFQGPPGVGKTACAEGVARELGRNILVADYSRIQNRWVGQTEKNIVAVFKAAGDENALLFWDEADAMFYDRDKASHSWEVRDVNVLLQEIERFEGVCILATNRRISLDPALARRISMEVAFERPDPAMRAEIWKKLLPGKLPLAADVDIARLAAWDLSGGEIKNVVLNAARIALTRSRTGRLRVADFEAAVEFVKSTGKKPVGTIGFSREA
jgi:AAA+ superfamily predicted ATPase